MKYYLKPYKFPEYTELATPMPYPKKLKKLEKIKEKGINVEYPVTPWFTNNQESIEKEKEDRQKRIDEASNAHLLPEYPLERSKKNLGEKKIRIQRK